MAWSTQQMITYCFDQTTPTGEGGDKIQAQYNAMAFNACLAPIQQRMKLLKEENRLAYALLMFFHTESSFSDKDVEEINTHMRYIFWLNIDTKGLHEKTYKKINRFLPMVLNYCKGYQDPEYDNKHQIAIALDLKDHWYEKGRKINWDQAFKDQLEELARVEDWGLAFMEEARLDVMERFEEPAIKEPEFCYE